MYDGFNKKTNINNIQKYILTIIKKSPKIFLFITLLSVFTLMTILNPRFISISNIINISRQMSINLIIAVGQTLCITSGGIDLSVGSIGIMSGCISGVVLAKTGNVSLSIIIGLICGLLAGLINGLIITKVKIAPIVTTLATMTITRAIALLVTGGYVITNFPDSFNFLGVGYYFNLPVPVIIMLLVVFFGHVLLSKTEFGLNISAIGDNYKAARLAGLKIDSVLIKVYMLSSFLSALGGIILTARVISAQPSLMITTNLDVIAAVIIGGTSLRGGTGTIIGTILGTILLATVYNGFNLAGVQYEWQLIVCGSIIIVAVMLDNVSKITDI